MSPEGRFIPAVNWGRVQVLACLAALFILGCGGSGDYHASGGIGGTGATIGTITGHGSIIVNGIRFDTSSAFIEIEDNAPILPPIGREVVVQGLVTGRASGAAHQIRAFFRVRGPLQALEALDDRQTRLTVMGQTVFVHPQTVLAGIDLDRLALDMVLEVSGPVDESTGAIHAGYILYVENPVENPDLPMAVKGRVRESDPGQHTINDLAVDFRNIQEIPQNWIGRLVAVRGDLYGGILVADAAEPFEADVFETAAFFCLEGFAVSPGGSGGQWAMGAYDLQFDNQTYFEEGLAEDDLPSGIRLRVRGTLHNRVILVDEIRIADRVHLASRVASIDLTNGGAELTLEGMVPLVVRSNELTRFGARARELNDVEVGDHVRIHGHWLDNHTAVAALVLLFSPQHRQFHLEGPVTSIGAFHFDVLGVAVDTEANADIRFYDTDEEALDVGDFMAALVEGTLVRVTGRWDDDGRLLYQEMRLLH